MLALSERQPSQHARGQRQRDQAERQVDPEDQRPMQMLGQHAAQHRAADRGRGEHRADITLVAAALLRRHDIGDDGLRQRHQPAAAEALQGAPEDQRGHRRRHRASHGAGDENHDRGQHDRAPAVDVGELAVERRRRGRGQQIGGHHPGQALDVVEGAAHGRQGGRDDGLIERAEKHRQHQADDDGAGFGMRQRAGLRRRRNLAVAALLRLSFRRLRRFRQFARLVVHALSWREAETRARPVSRRSTMPCHPPSTMVAASRAPAAIPYSRRDNSWRSASMLAGIVSSPSSSVVTAEPRSAALCLRNACKIAQRPRQAHQHADVALAFDRRLLARRQPRLDIAHLALGGAQQAVDQRDIVRLQRAPPLAGDLTPSRNRIHALAVIARTARRRDRHRACRATSGNGRECARP